MTGTDGFSQVGRVDVNGVLGELGERVRRRPDPRLGIGLAGVGMLMILIGIVAWAGDVAANSVDEPSDSPNIWLGVVESLVIIAIGIVLLVRFQRGPVATAGVVASALGVPVCLAFLTFDPADIDPDVYLDLPFNLDAIAIVSLAAWLAAFARLPYGKGRTFYLGASSVFLWLYTLEKIEQGSVGSLVTLPFRPVVFMFEEFGGPEPAEPTTIGVVTLLFGAGYYALAVWLDRKGYRGIATAFAAVGAFTVPLGLAHLGGDLEPAGVGAVLVVLGLVLAAYGANQGRRFTTWGWCVGAGLGALLIIADFTEDDLAVFGVAAILLGAFVIVMAHILTVRLAEPDEMTPGPSGLRLSSLGGAVTVTSPWPTQQTPYGTPPPPGQPIYPGQPGQPPYPTQPTYPAQPTYAGQPAYPTEPTYPTQPPQAPAPAPPPPPPPAAAPVEGTEDPHRDWRPPPPPPPPPG